MIILTDRMVQTGRIHRILQQLRPCAIAPIHQALSQPAVFSTIICDVRLDTGESLELMMAALAHHRTKPSIPVLFLLRDPSVLTQEQARMAGATATLPYTASPEELLAVVRGLRPSGSSVGQEAPVAAVVAAAAEDMTATLANLFEGSVKNKPVAVAQLQQGSELLLQAIRHARIQNWLDVVSAYDDVTYQHCLLVAGLTAAFALELGLQPNAQQLLVQAALVHDLGKAHIPHDILNKPGRLTPPETNIMRRHAAIGYEMLKRQTRLNPVLLDVTRHHHELLDGTGYPDRLSGDQISRPVRMVTICDIYAALVERRPYKPPMTAEMALAHLDELGPKLDRSLLLAFRGVVVERDVVRLIGGREG